MPSQVLQSKEIREHLRNSFTAVFIRPFVLFVQQGTECRPSVSGCLWLTAVYNMKSQLKSLVQLLFLERIQTL